jgi:hypothetical protein
MVLSTVHAYSGAVFALASGTKPWDLIDFEAWKRGPGGSDDGDDEDDDDGEAIPSSADIRSILAHMGPSPTGDLVLES